MTIIQQNRINWTRQEWACIAKRASALKAIKPEMSRLTILPISQDDIVPERRRAHFNNLAGVKPLFEILGLDESGNQLPNPQPPERPEQSTPPARQASLADTPTDLLVTELFNRGAAFKSLAENVVKAETAIRAALDDRDAKFNATLQRVDEVEDMVLKGMEAIDRLKFEQQEMAKVTQNLAYLHELAEYLTAGKFQVPPPKPAVPQDEDKNQRLARVKLQNARQEQHATAGRLRENDEEEHES